MVQTPSSVIEVGSCCSVDYFSVHPFGDSFTYGPSHVVLAVLYVDIVIIFLAQTFYTLVGFS